MGCGRVHKCIGGKSNATNDVLDATMRWRVAWWRQNSMSLKIPEAVYVVDNQARAIEFLCASASHGTAVKRGEV
jgi:hypothetical protein